jgi:hypothetical protein
MASDFPLYNIPGFGYTVADIKKYIADLKRRVEGFETGLGHEQTDLRDLARRGLSILTPALDYANSHTPQQLLSEVRTYFDMLEEDKRLQTDPDEVKLRLYQVHGDHIQLLGNIVSGGWFHEVLQAKGGGGWIEFNRGPSKEQW